MWFKNLQIYRFTQPFQLTSNELDNALSQHAFKPCSSHDPYAYGWVSPLGNKGKEFVHSANGYMMICAKRQEKLLPASVINEQLAEKTELIAEQEHRKISLKEKIAFREDIVFELLPKAFSRTQMQFAYIDTHQNLLVINCSSESRAEELINALRDAIGSVPVIPLGAKNMPVQTMTHWLNHHCPQGFSLGEECELTDNAEKSSRISCRGQNLLADEIQSHLAGGMSATKLALVWGDRLSCVINDKLGIRKLKFSDIVQEEAARAESDDAIQQFDIDFTIMTLEISGFISALMSALGGESQ